MTRKWQVRGLFSMILKHVSRSENLRGGTKFKFKKQSFMHPDLGKLERNKGLVFSKFLVLWPIKIGEKCSDWVF